MGSIEEKGGEVKEQRRGERPARRIMEGSKVIPRAGESMKSQGKPGSHSNGNDASSEQ